MVSISQKKISIKNDFFSNNDFLMFDLINGDLSSALKVYYEKVGGYDSLDC